MISPIIMVNSTELHGEPQQISHENPMGNLPCHPFPTANSPFSSWGFHFPKSTMKIRFRALSTCSKLLEMLSCHWSPWRSSETMEKPLGTFHDLGSPQLYVYVYTYIFICIHIRYIHIIYIYTWGRGWMTKASGVGERRKGRGELRRDCHHRVAALFVPTRMQQWYMIYDI